MTITCECGKQLFLKGTHPGWSVDFRGPVIFKCPCGKEEVFKIEQVRLK